tara:strand:- start:123 stop:299 length:177 start_codon:yes stop_codon:yes gene_type:complete
MLSGEVASSVTASNNRILKLLALIFHPLKNIEIPFNSSVKLYPIIYNALPRVAPEIFV